MNYFLLIITRFIFIICILLINCKDSNNLDSFSLEGKWKDIKSDSIYEKDRKEILFDIQRFGKEFTGKVISLDNAIDSKGDIRQCNKCLDIAGSRMLLGFPIIENLRKVENKNKYIGKIFDIQQRKWFDLSIEPVTENEIKVRIFAGVPLFGKSFKWERGENYYNQIISKSPSELKKEKGVYALTLGEINSKNDKEVFLKSESVPKFINNKKVYFYSLDGKKSAEGDFQDFFDGQARIKITEKFANFSIQTSISVIFFRD